ncbi:uncharacterized protein B0H18DRAFT_1018283, partial [Fomitopsis serialis]|uniref:uncharacterized protein n=1 Tax=Fomitopsis serialis TaxID=139415 RepID=UPI0020080B36
MTRRSFFVRIGTQRSFDHAHWLWQFSCSADHNAVNVSRSSHLRFGRFKGDWLCSRPYGYVLPGPDCCL